MTDTGAGMSLEQRIGQLMVVGFSGTAITPDIVDLIQRYHVGGIILFSRNIHHNQQLQRLTDDLQAIAQAVEQPYPLLIMTDQENGMVRRLGKGATIFPGNMAQGAIGDEQATFEIAQASGYELRSLGVNMNLAPVVDVNNNPTNPVIGARSFGEDPIQVADLTAAAVQGYRAARVIPTLKHFPGHGDTTTDSHIALPTIPHGLERMEAVELLPFQRGFMTDADCVMTAHVHFPHLVGSEPLPATLSPHILRGLLREKLGFKGVVITDCMEMNAIISTVGTERGCVLSLQAGADLLLVSHSYRHQVGSIEAIKAALHSGELAEEVINTAVARVLEMKARYLSWSELPATIAPEIGGEGHRQISQQAYARSTTLVRNDEQILPLQLAPQQRVVVITPRKDATIIVEDRPHPASTLADEVRLHHGQVTQLHMGLRPTAQERAKLCTAAQDADLIIVATMNACIYQQQAELVQQLIQTGRRVIGVALRDPYDLMTFPQLGTYLTIYEYTQPALEAVVRVLFGEAASLGRLPVSLPGLYERGYGLALPVIHTEAVA